MFAVPAVRRYIWRGDYVFLAVTVVRRHSAGLYRTSPNAGWREASFDA
jgi:hypothetical protein